MELEVYKIDGTQSGEKISLNESVFSVEPNDHLIHRAVLSYQAAQRQGTHLARNRALVSGSMKKPYRQKGTGRARAGSVKSNIWRGGGKAFGPQPHEYHVGINKKEKQLARRSALTYKAKDLEILIVEDFNVDKVETKFVSSVLRALNISNEKERSLIITKEHAPSLWKSMRNLKNVSLMPAMQLSTYDIVRPKRLIIQKSAAEFMNEAM